MKPSLPIYFAWISLLVTVVSCRAPEILLNGERDEYIDPAGVAGPDDRKTFKATVSYRDKEISGRIMVKKMNEGVYRTAFFNELGMTYLEGTLDLSGDNGKFTAGNVIPVLDHERFLKKFEKMLISLTVHDLQ